MSTKYIVEPLFVFNVNVYFMFNDEYNGQINEAVMESFLRSMLANILLEKLESRPLRDVF